MCNSTSSSIANSLQVAEVFAVIRDLSRKVVIRSISAEDYARAAAEFIGPIAGCGALRLLFRLTELLQLLSELKPEVLPGAIRVIDANDELFERALSPPDDEGISPERVKVVIETLQEDEQLHKTELLKGPIFNNPVYARQHILPHLNAEQQRILNLDACDTIR